MTLTWGLAKELEIQGQLSYTEKSTRDLVSKNQQLLKEGRKREGFAWYKDKQSLY